MKLDILVFVSNVSGLTISSLLTLTCVVHATEATHRLCVCIVEAVSSNQSL